MEIGKIIEKLEDFSPHTVAKAHDLTYIQTHKMIKPGETCFYPACVYIGYSSELPDSVSGEGVYSLICINDKVIPQKLIDRGNINLYLLPDGTNQYDVLNRVADIMIDEASLVAGMRRILDALYSNAGLQNMVEVASEVFENPVFINDTAYKILAMPQNTLFQDTTLEEEKELGYIHENNVWALKKGQVFQQIHRSNKTLLFKRPNTDEEWLFISVKLHNIVVADIGIVSANRQFRDSDYEMLDRFSKLVAVEMEKHEFFKENKGVMINYFLEDLLSGKLKDPKSIHQRARFLDWKMNSWFKVAVIVDRENDFFENKAQRLGAQMRERFPECRWTIHKKNFVALISRANKEILLPDEREAFNSFLRDNNLTAGISDPFSDILEIEFYYRQAFRSVEIGINVLRSPGSYNYSDMMIYYIAQSLSKQNDLYDFRHTAIIALQKYDVENSTNLLETLKVHLSNPSDQAAAIKALNIHRNTFFYRINRIKEITHTDIDNGDERLKMQLYLKFLEYQKDAW